MLVFMLVLLVFFLLLLFVFVHFGAHSADGVICFTTRGRRHPAERCRWRDGQGKHTQGKPGGGWIQRRRRSDVCLRDGLRLGNFGKRSAHLEHARVEASWLVVGRSTCKPWE
uniref:Putative secreted protein ovary overexpressed n=1 Tax=Rhipicephalus microplus TaxID=6941 RepID=A0A6M2DBZ8_RHIMP